MTTGQPALPQKTEGVASAAFPFVTTRVNPIRGNRG